MKRSRGTALSPLSAIAGVPIRRETAGQLLSPREVAALLGVHAETVRLWLRRGLLAGIKLGDVRQGRPRWRVSDAALAAFLAAATGTDDTRREEQQT